MTHYMLLRIVGIFSSLIGVLLILFGGIKTSENFRVLSDIIQNVLVLNIVLLVFLPKDRDLKVAVLIGGFTMIFDYILETVAFYYGWWYALGGTQYPPLLVIPLEMVLSFFMIGTAMGILFTFPQKIRSMDFKLLNWTEFFFKNPKLDYFWLILLLFLNALIGTHGDYTAGNEIWVPGPYWHPLYTLIVWFGGGLITLILYFILKKKIRIELKK